MGLTLNGYGVSSDIPYSGFYRLRCDIASMLSDDIGQLYAKMPDTLRGSESMRKQWENEINAAINGYLDSHSIIMAKVTDFLFMSDEEGMITYGTCKALVRLIDKKGGPEFSSTVYGYAGWGDKACRGRDILNILKSCADNKKPMVWY